MKTSLTDLAIFGGIQAFREKLHVGRPNIGNRQQLFDRINDILDRRWLTNNGPFVQEFEKRISDLLGVKHCIAMSNGTVALEITARALGLKGEVIIPAFTFIATAHALQWQGITPVFCDIHPANYNIDPKRIESLITPRTTGIIAVHIWGRPCDVDALLEIAQKFNIRLVFDAAHAFGCSYNGQMVGKFGSAEVFSFHATKFLNTFEGGAVVTNDDDLALKIRLMKNFGFAGYDNVINIGTNGKMSEVSAVMGLTSLESMDKFVEINRRNYKQYQRELNGVSGIRLLSFDENEQCNYQYICLEVNEDIINISRDQICRVLKAENVMVRRYFYPGCHRMEPYRSYFPHSSLLLPNTDRLASRVIAVPTGMAISPYEVKRIAQIIRFVVSRGEEIREKLPQ